MFTYLELLSRILEKPRNKAKQAKLMHALGYYLQARDLSIHDEIDGWREGDENTRIHLNYVRQRSNCLEQSHFASIRTLIDFYIKEIKAQKVEADNLPELLRKAMKRKMVLDGAASFKQLLKEAGLEQHHALIAGWYSKNKVPENTSEVRQILCVLETFLQLRRNRLIDLLNDKSTDSSFRRMESNYSKKMSLILRSSHAYNGKSLFSAERTRFPMFAKEWADYVNFKSMPVYENPGFRRNTKNLWKAVRPEQNEAHRHHWHCYNDLGLICPSSDRAFRCINSYLSFLCIPTEEPTFKPGFIESLNDEERKWVNNCFVGEGFDPSEVSIAHIANTRLIGKFVNWHMKRQGSTHGIVDHLETFKTLVNTNDGWLFQKTELSQIIGVPSEGWEKHCRDTHTYISDTIGALTNVQQTKHSRDPKEPIRPYLASDSPLSILIELEDRIIANKPSNTQKATYAIWIRDLLICRFLRYNPLRAGTLAQLTIFRQSPGDNEGMVFKDKGRWCLNIPAVAFKNMNGSRDENYRAILHSSVGELIEEYLAYRHYLKGSDRCPYLLRPKKRAQIKEEKEDNAIAGSDLGRVYRLITQKYLVGTSGFGPHAVRHLVASAWLKHQPRDYVTVASILHDKLETVLNEYAHIDVNDGLKRYYEYSDKTIEYNTM